MATVVDAVTWEVIDAFVEPFERDTARGVGGELRQYLPAVTHPNYLAVLRELVRVDLEYGWDCGRPTRVEEYLAAFPELQTDLSSLTAISFEEYRLRRRAGQQPSLAEYRDRFGVDTLGWQDWQTVEGTPAANCFAGPENPGENANGLFSSDDLESAAWVYLHRRRAASGSELHELASVLQGLPDSTEHTDFFLDLDKRYGGGAEELARALTSMPALGHSFQGFDLIRELGRGAFSRVYLARQPQLADRYVALKVCSELLTESHTLAQLQHSNIVPIYSVHREEPLQALCMPYFGATTLVDVLRELRGLPQIPSSGRWLVELLARRTSDVGMASAHAGILTLLASLSYENAVLWLAARLTEGLAHAHERGILHGDLKPANVLLSDEGQPMLLDFNLSTKPSLRTWASVALVGGTLPYMAPEQLESCLDGRPRAEVQSDLYGLGLVLFELLTGKYPFPQRQGNADRLIELMLADRRSGAPDVRSSSRGVSPAVASIVRRCLQPDAGHRYASAHDLVEDLERQRAYRPLKHAKERSLRERGRKWRRRHPRLTSIYGIGAIALIPLLTLVALYTWRTQQLVRLEAASALRNFREELRTAQLLLGGPAPSAQDRREGIEVADRALARYGVLGGADWKSAPAVTGIVPEERERLWGEASELLVLLSRGERLNALDPDYATHREEHLERALSLNELAEQLWPTEEGRKTVKVQRALLLQLTGRTAEASALLKQATALPARTAPGMYLSAIENMSQGEYAPARELLRQASRQDPRNAFVWYALGMCYAGLGDSRRAVASFDTSIALWPRFHGSYYHRGRTHLDLKDYKSAILDFDEAIRLRPDYVPAYADRGLARAAVNDDQAAIADLTHALDAGFSQTRVYFDLARLRARMGDVRQAEIDRQKGLQVRPSDEVSWVVRGIARLAGDDAAGAVADFDEALKLNPRSREALQNKAHVLAEKLGRTTEAIAVLDKEVATYPDDALARAGRGVLLARQGKRRAALDDAEAALRLDTEPSTLYQVAGIYALSSREQPDDRRQAIRLLSSALRGGFGFDLLETDPDLAPVRQLPEFRRLVAASRGLHGGAATPSEQR
jgi:serine/threonine protein kinase/Flp pilus assembly protein TadD